MHKNKPHKGLIKRIRVTKTGKIKSRRAFGGHLRSHKSGSLMRSYARPAYCHKTDLGRVKAMLAGARP